MLFWTLIEGLQWVMMVHYSQKRTISYLLRSAYSSSRMTSPESDPQTI